MKKDAFPPLASALIAVAGPSAAGVAIGMPLGTRQMLIHAAVVPGIVVGVTLFMIPALYIASTLAGVSPPADCVARAALCGLRSTGVLLLGLSPALLFLLSTTPVGFVSLLLIAAVLAAAAVAGMRALYKMLFDSAERAARSIPVFAAWAVVCFGLATHLMIQQTGRPYFKCAMKDVCEHALQMDTEVSHPPTIRRHS